MNDSMTKPADRDLLVPRASPPPKGGQQVAASEQEEGLVKEDLLIEDISIDGMCGVY